MHCSDADGNKYDCFEYLGFLEYQHGADQGEAGPFVVQNHCKPLNLRRTLCPTPACS